MKIPMKPFIILSVLMILLFICSAGCISVQIKNDPAPLPTQMQTPLPTPVPTSLPSPAATAVQTQSVFPTAVNVQYPTFEEISGKVFVNNDVDGHGTEMTLSVNAASGAVSLTVTPGKEIDYSLEDIGLSLSEIGSSDPIYMGRLDYVFNATKLSDREYQLDRVGSWIYTYNIPGYHGTSGVEISDDTFLPDRGRLTVIDANTLSATFTMPALQVLSQNKPVIFSS